MARGGQGEGNGWGLFFSVVIQRGWVEPAASLAPTQNSRQATALECSGPAATGCEDEAELCFLRASANAAVPGRL